MIKFSLLCQAFCSVKSDVQPFYNDIVKNVIRKKDKVLLDLESWALNFSISHNCKTTNFDSTFISYARQLAQIRILQMILKI